MRYSRTGIIAVLIAAEVFIAGVIIVSAGGLKNFSVSANDLGSNYSRYSPPAVAVGSRPHVVIDDADSRVTLTASSDGKIHVIDASRLAGWGWGSRPGKLQMHVTGDGVFIQRPGRSGHGIFFGMDFGRTEIAVPPDATVDVQHSSGADLSDLTGTVHVRSDDGHITARSLRSKDLSLSSGDGHISLQDVAADKLDAVTSDGSIRASGLRVGNGSLHTGDGSITLVFADTGNLTLHARTGDGSISVNGARQSDSSPLDYKLGNGAGSLDVSTQDGSIRVTSKGAL